MLLIAIACYCLLLLATACYCLLLLAIACYCLLLLAIARYCLLLLAIACFCLLLLAIACAICLDYLREPPGSKVRTFIAYYLREPPGDQPQALQHCSTDSVPPNIYKTSGIPIRSPASYCLLLLAIASRRPASHQTSIRHPWNLSLIHI